MVIPVGTQLDADKCPPILRSNDKLWGCRFTSPAARTLTLTRDSPAHIAARRLTDIYDMRHAAGISTLIARAAQHPFHRLAWWPPVALLRAQQHHLADAPRRFGRVPRPQRPLAPPRRLPVGVLIVIGATLLTLCPFDAGIFVAVGATPLT